MANALYTKAKENLLRGLIHWDADDIKAVLTDAGAYTLDIATHEFLSDVPAGARIATSGNLAGKSYTGGVADATDVTITSVSGVSVEYVILYQDTGVEGTSRLIACLDSYTSLPLNPNGGNVVIQWPSDAAKIFAL